MADNEEGTIEVVETPVEAMLAAQGVSTPSTFGDDVPEAYRGKQVADVFAEVERLQNTLKISNEMVQRLASQPQVVHVQPQQTATPPVTDLYQGPNDEQLAEMMASDDPKLRVEAVRAMNERNNMMLAQALERRLAPLQQGTLSAAEATARAKFPVEFELFEKEIEQYKGRVNPQVLTHPEAWEEMMRTVRGIDPVRFVTEQQKRSGITSIDQLRATAQASAPFVPRSSGPAQPAGPGAPSRLDDLQRKIAADFGMSEDEYIHLDKTGMVLNG